ncbi:hypothetical protein [Natranaeroarchaeum aerophilus]|nr:hypothetical protein [Natranaeroarchaeum aerophilus]
MGLVRPVDVWACRQADAVETGLAGIARSHAGPVASRRRSEQ